MSNYSIEVKNISKRYRLGAKEELHDTIGGAFYSWIKSPVENYRRLKKLTNFDNFDASDIIWALKDISFKVKSGEVLGVIGKNGAGKSTLLKILSRITPPTSGTINLHGRVASLLEVGTGFHPDLTGRENVYMNGTILGMTTKEIKSKFDEIVAFSGVEEFIDTPVKRYSSGMRVRLAFSVAAHLEPEILLIDEVLAVGDAEFQKMCLGKMKNVSKDGRTVIFVSHNMGAVQALCDRAILLNHGETSGISNISKAIDEYLYGEKNERKPVYKTGKISLNNDAYINKVRFVDVNGEIKNNFYTYEQIFIEITWTNNNNVPVNCSILVKNGYGVKSLISIDVNMDWDGTKKQEKGKYKNSVMIPAHYLNTGDYYLSTSLDTASPKKYCYHKLEDILHFRIEDKLDQRSITKGNYRINRDDVVLWPALDWSFEKLEK